MSILFSSDSVLPSEIIVCILLLLSPDDLLSLKLVCKDWLLALSEPKFREIQVLAWKKIIFMLCTKLRVQNISW